jgi:hypothetical protein
VQFRQAIFSRIFSNFRKYEYTRKRNDDTTCREDWNYSCEFGSWKKFERKSLGGIAQPYGQKKFRTLAAAQKYACDKDRILGISLDNKGMYCVRSGSLGFRDSKETTWKKQFSNIVIALSKKIPYYERKNVYGNVYLCLNKYLKMCNYTTIFPLL